MPCLRHCSWLVCRRAVPLDPARGLTAFGSRCCGAVHVCSVETAEWLTVFESRPLVQSALADGFTFGTIDRIMSSVTVELDLPRDWDDFQMPQALKSRLTDLLDQQDNGLGLTDAEREEAQALTELSEMLSLMKLRSEVAAQRQK